MKKLFVKDGEHRAVRGGRGEERHGQTDQRPRAPTNAPDQNLRGKNEFGLKNCHSGHKAKKPIPTPAHSHHHRHNKAITLIVSS